MESLSLPQASIVKILREALPANVSVSRDVKVAFQRAAALFVLYVTHTANQMAKDTKRNTLTADDIMAALEDLEFDPLLEPLQEYLGSWRKSNEKNRLKIKEAAQAARLLVADKNPTGNAASPAKKPRKSRAKGKRKSGGETAGAETSEAAKKKMKSSKQKENEEEKEENENASENQNDGQPDEEDEIEESVTREGEEENEAAAEAKADADAEAIEDADE